MNEAKIRLSPKEQELVNKADWILTKNTILLKVRDLLAGLQETLQEYFRLHGPSLPEEMGLASPKISKGENYKGLPYLILDYPRFFQQENVFAIRTMFWWGNFFSITLHLSGNPKKMFEENIIRAHSSLKEKGFFYCIEDNPWEHHFELSNYVQIQEMTTDDFENSVRERYFVKLAHKIPLAQWEDAPGALFHYFKQFIEMMKD
jgi:hypothetical protein